MERNKGVNGHNFFSCGDGNLYQGSIKEIMNGLRSASLAEPNNKYVEEGLKYLSSKFPALNPANTFRGVVNEIKPDEPASTAPRPKNSPI